MLYSTCNIHFTIFFLHMDLKFDVNKSNDVKYNILL